MDWLSKRKFVIVCHEKVVRIPLKDDEILRVHGERTQGVVKTLMNTKVDEPKWSDISVVRDFIDVFPEDLSMTTTTTNNSKEWNSGDDRLRLRWMNYLVVLTDATESVRDAIGFEYCLASSSGWTKSPVLWAKIGEGSLIGPELVLETTDKVVLIKEKLKVARVGQKSYADNRRKPLEFEIGKQVLLKVSPWKGEMRFEILKRIGPVAYRLRLPKELSEVHDTFHVSNLKEYWTDANMHVPLERIKSCYAAICTLVWASEVVSSGFPAIVKVRWNSKRGPEFTWDHEDHMKAKHP
ncbi:hypothetical protein Tco_0212036 [Tanacetum coccineum]